MKYVMYLFGIFGCICLVGLGALVSFGMGLVGGIIAAVGFGTAGIIEAIDRQSRILQSHAQLAATNARIAELKRQS